MPDFLFQLLTLAAGTPSGQERMAVTLCKEKRHLKQRMTAIAKRGLWSVLGFLPLITVVSGCTLVPGAEQSADESYRSALLGETPIVCYKDGGSSPVSVGEVPEVFSPDSEYTKIHCFSLVDLDGDGESEAVLQIIDVAGDMGGFLVLRREGGEVLGFPRSYREFESLKTDGTYGFSSAAGTEWGVCSGGFSGKEYTPKTLISGKIGDDRESFSYLIEGLPASEEEYNAATDQQEQKPDAVWYEFTGENIERAFSGVAPWPPVPENTPASN